MVSPVTQLYIDKYHMHRKVIRDFFEFVPESQYDTRLVHTKTKKSDSIRETLAHIIEVQLMYIEGLKNKKLEFKDMGVSNYYTASKETLLKEMEKVEKEMLAYLASKEFSPDERMEAPWGNAPKIGVLDAFIDHEIMHVGWNIAYMDLLEMDRYPSLQEVWG